MAARASGWRVLLLSALAGMSGCASSIASLPIEGGVIGGWCCTRGTEAVSLQYLGVGGWLIRVGGAARVDDATEVGGATETGGAALMTAPFFSNPSLLDVGLGGIAPDTAAIDRHLPPVPDVSAVLVGHAHYDHLMDVPRVLRAYVPHATLYGSRTAVNLLHGAPRLDPEHLVSVEEAAGDHRTAGKWFHTPDGRVRFMPLLSGHAPHLAGVHLYRGQVDAPADTLPGRAGGWVEGTPLAYLVDILSPDGEVVYRIHYQDAASTPPDGFPPPLDDGISVDLAILCAPGYEEVTGYPEGILRRLRPRHVLVGHWEDFFRSRDEELRVVPGTDLQEFLQRVEEALPAGSRWALLEPDAEVAIASGAAAHEASRAASRTASPEAR